MTHLSMDKRLMMEWTVRAEEHNLLLREFAGLKGISKRGLTAIKYDGGGLFLNGEEVTVRKACQTGDIVKVYFPPETRSKSLIPEDLGLEVLYEDSWLIAVYKPAGMNTIPSRDAQTGSLANALAGYFDRQEIAAGIHIATRLDKDTSGVVLAAKYAHIHHLLSEMQQSNQVNREYNAIAEGIVTAVKGTIDQPIAREPGSIITRMVDSHGQRAVTHYEVLAVGDRHTMLSFRLETGRTHQIRVHASWLGHPLAGDDLYGGHCHFISRQALHCRKLQLLHPVTQENLEVESPLPEDMIQCMKRTGMNG
ncbi:RluA family pseudouridine synthase [Jeotgalibacillus haloalkalitolerans]|uniref:Pseudouridine synthase n=1 Tax=Jeotgalibacillus haloalkalitolerans TaxID=3104292 RepID=A0ABU5KPD3_9BACL|nr:RluA family pseudouridine synthase [Jeotgalibacillus sp. HH7-29]MDZ5712994.1 RluA family pseudouridine synthase [Jeotgalibacillus sp. HH7-29]